MDYDNFKIKKKICVLVGAGMSAGAGIPTFRGEHGSWETDKQVRQAFEIEHYQSSSTARRLLWRWLAESPAWSAQPTQAHWALKQLDDAGNLVSLMTQNFDMLEKRAGIRQGKIRQLHGRIDKSVCLGCGRYFDTKPLCGQLADNPDPHCPDCGGIIKPDIVFFGEPLDDTMMKVISGLDIPACDELWCVGSSLTVYPAAGIPLEAKSYGCTVVIVSTEPTALDGMADQIIHQPANVAVSALVEQVINDNKQIR